MSGSEPIVRFVGIGKTYDGVTRVVDELDLDIERGEFLTLLGPSGSGKTTTLMLLAGFETPTAGEILLEGKPLSRVPPYQRNIGMVFQNYALFPHMSVAENIGFPLSVRGVPAADIAKRVERALDMVQLGGFGRRRPAQLSGGQQQRVAVARALVFEPKLILMDEPLGALDKQLREQMQLEIRRLHQRLGVTMVYVTHDQAEALTMSDRIAVFHRGRIQQLDTPEQMYEYPKNAFVARFIGENNRLDGSLETNADGRCTIRIDGSDTRIDGTLVEPVQERRRGHRIAAAGAGANPRGGAYNRRASRMPPRRVAAGDHLSRRPRPGARRADRQRRVHGEAPDFARRRPCRASARRSKCFGRPSIAARLRRKASGADHVLSEEANMQSRKIWIVALAAAALVLSATALARDLTVVSWGGAYQDAQREVYFKPFMEKTKIKMTEENWDGGVGTLRAKIQGGNNNWDVVQVESEELLLGCEEGLYEKLDWAKLGGKDKYLPDAVNDCGVGAIVYSFILAYDGDKIKGDAPKSWADFWNVQKWPGKRALRKGPKTTLEIALMADGVAPKDVYKMLGTSEGVERAFKKLDQLKPNLVWWEKGSQPPQLLASGEVAMTDAYNGRIAAANDKDKKNFKIVWTNNLYTIDSWVIMKGYAEQGAGRDVPACSSTIRRTRRTCRRRSPTARRPRRRRR